MLRTVRHRDLSLWQSAVAEVLRGELPDTGAALAHQVALTHQAVLSEPMMHAVNEHVLRHAAGEALVAPSQGVAVAGEDGGGTDALSEDAYVSYLHFRMAEAQLAGDDAELARLRSECRKYATCNWSGWMQCMATYSSYKKKHKEPLYRDWKASRKDIASYGVIEYRLPPNGKVGLLGDWGTGLGDAKALLADALKHRPDVLIHLGDIYYSGTPDECTLNVQGIVAQVFEELGIPRIPVYSIPGNHDYYAFGAGFYPLIDAMNPHASWQQEASYFCLRSEDDQWQLLGMDTGRQDYWPLNDYDPSYDGPSLQPSEIAWHADKLSHFPGATILLSHHQLFSQSSKISNHPRGWLNEHLLEIFEPWFPRVAAWFWGHEHNLALFQDGLYGLAKGRLVGCSAYEESTGESPYKPHSAEFARNVPYRDDPPVEVSQADEYYAHGYAILELGDPGTVTYYEYPSWGKEEPVNKPKGKKLASEPMKRPEPRPPAGDPVKYGDRFYLGHSQGDHVVAFKSGRQYYPRLGSTGAVALELKGGVKTLKHGDVIQIRSTEEDLGKYDYLGAWSDAHDVYYYKKDYNQKKQGWRVLKKSDIDDLRVHYGDELYIQNVSFEGQRLAKDGDYITTARNVPDFWLFAQEPPVVKMQADGAEPAAESTPPKGTAAEEMPSPS